MQSGLFCKASERNQTVMGLRNEGQHCAGSETCQCCLFAGCFIFLFLGPTKNFRNYNGNCIVELLNITYILSDV